MLPYASETLMIQRIVNNEIDSCLSLSANTIAQTLQNPNVVTHTGTEPPYGYIDWWPTSMWFNHLDGPFTAKEMRWAVSYSIDRQQLIDVGLGGSGMVTPLPFPLYPVLQQYFDAAAPLLEKYPTNEYSLEKAAALLEGLGYAKDGDGFWVKDGERIPTVISGWQVFNDIGPIITEQLRRAALRRNGSRPPTTARVSVTARRRSGLTATVARLPTRSPPWTSIPPSTSLQSVNPRHRPPASTTRSTTPSWSRCPLYHTMIRAT